MPVYWHTRTASIEQVKYKGINVFIFCKKYSFGFRRIKPERLFFTLPSKQKYKSMIYN